MRRDARISVDAVRESVPCVEGTPVMWSPGMSLRVLLALVAIVAAAFARPDSARAGPCADRVIVDSTDGRVDGVYELRCYGDALDDLPEDVRAYSSAEDVISRALYARVAAVTAKAAKQPKRRPPAAAAASRRAGAGSQPAAAELPRSFPVPIVLLAALALLIGCAASGSLVSRRLGARRLLRRC